MKKTAYFISDAHLGLKLTGGEGREAALLSFLGEIAPRAESLFIVGDLFDFWIEYRRAVRPDYFEVLHQLRSLVKAGTDVHYCLGNHDFGVGSFLKENIGIDVRDGSAPVALQGKRIRVIHGDGMRRRDIGGRIMSRILRCRFNQSLYKIIHPNIGIWLAEKISGFSRNHLTSDASEEELEEYRLLARGYIEAGDDIVVFGHTHFAEIGRLSEGIYCNTGAWLRQYPFARLADGQMTLWEFLPGNSPRPIHPTSYSPKD